MLIYLDEDDAEFVMSSFPRWEDKMSWENCPTAAGVLEKIIKQVKEQKA